MRLYALAVYLFLYLPIAVIAIFSFNAGRHASQFTGFSVQWYGKALSNPFVTEALWTSFIVAPVLGADRQRLWHAWRRWRCRA
jgi:spermidine/putrescine transport system permease protein